MNNAEYFIVKLYEARIAAKASKKVIKLAAERLGSCPGIGDNENAGIKCFQSKLPQEKWCDICKEKLPLWIDYRANSILAGSTLRQVLRIAKSIKEKST